ncbi:MAG TPA: stage II sporulation protein M [Gemmatimonadales bacterium]|jgi:uncharacterized membrane protein SpoIIM required for sporulation|nr:stage II sporulation protein M [Gemmatimonadales bacterium]
MTAPHGTDYRQHFAIETPEHVLLDYEVAGVGTRMLAALIDWTIIAVVLLIVDIVRLRLGSVSGWIAAIDVLLSFVLIWSYFTLFEGLRGGQTPGKHRLGIRVIADNGHGVNVAEAAARNLLLPIDMLGLVGLFVIALHPRAKRIGDLVAGTVVVRDQPEEVSVPVLATDLAETDTAGVPEFSDAEFRLLREFAQRSAALPADVRDRFAVGLAARFAARFPQRPQDNLLFVDQLYRAETARRRGRFGARTGGSTNSAVAERLIARKSTRWDEFQKLADRAAARGLDTFSARELPDFAARYREVAADLARVRTYGADPVVTARLERLVVAGHNALYHEDRQTWLRIWIFFAEECPRAVVQSWRYVLVSILVLILPALAGYQLLRQQPHLAAELIPDTMLERAEAAAARKAAGQGYVEANANSRPVVASEIITNNIGVAFRCFAGGIVLGVGAFIVVALNGLQLGAISAYYANMGVLGYLWTFVIGHGLLELFAICVSGAAGFLLGRAVIAPGLLPRRDALAIAGRMAIRMIGAVVVMLTLAGTIEGLLSASDAPLATRLVVSGATLLFLALYLLNGGLSRRSRSLGGRGSGHVVPVED